MHINLSYIPVLIFCTPDACINDNSCQHQSDEMSVYHTCLNGQCNLNEQNVYIE